MQSQWRRRVSNTTVSKYAHGLCASQSNSWQSRTVSVNKEVFKQTITSGRKRNNGNSMNVAWWMFIKKLFSEELSPSMRHSAHQNTSKPVLLKVKNWTIPCSQCNFFVSCLQTPVEHSVHGILFMLVDGANPDPQLCHQLQLAQNTSKQ